jgi:hypothetical protein
MYGDDAQSEAASGGSLWAGIGLALLCQFAYFVLVYELLSPEARLLGYMLFALVQFAYLFPLAVFFHKRKQGLTSNGVIITGVVSLLAAAAWFGYAAMNGKLPSISGGWD